MFGSVSIELLYVDLYYAKVVVLYISPLRNAQTQYVYGSSTEITQLVNFKKKTESASRVRS